MRNLIKYLFILSFGFLCFSTTYVHAQEKAPTFQQLIASGDKEYAKKEYIKAKTYYQEALRMRPKDANAKNKLDITLQKIREANKKEEQFFGHIDKADNFFMNSELEKALAEYNKALKIYPKDEYALAKKSEITTILKNEKEKLDSFNQMVALGDKLLKSEKYAEAVMQYESALKVYPNNQAARDKYQDAKNKKDTYDSKVSEFERLNKQGKEYAIRKKYAEAIASYEQALQLFPNDSELPGKISELKQTKDVADRYNAKISEADALYEDQSFLEAKEAYQAALTVIPDDSYSLSMIARVDEVVNSPEYKQIQDEKAKRELEEQRKEQARLAAIEAEKQRKAQVKSLIGTGNQQLTDKKYAEAEQTFKQVLALEPGNATATEKLGIIAGFYEEIQRQKLANYNKAMAAGNDAMDMQNYAEAITQYKSALANKPNDEVATQKLAAAQQSENQRLRAIEEEYNNYITQADNHFNSKNYDKAIEFYTKASNVDSKNPYPGERISKIGEILKANKMLELVSGTITVKSNQTKRISFKPIDNSVRRSNYISFKAKNNGTKPLLLYITYGKDGSENGSYTARVKNNGEFNDIIIRIGAQYKWFSEDNNWIEIYPENGDVEISTMEITKDN